LLKNKYRYLEMVYVQSFCGMWLYLYHLIMSKSLWRLH
jgi:hypothetical protein